MDIRKIAPVLLGAVFLTAPQAKADTRDDVITGIERCGVIHDDRVWLDCVYGADQPMRAKLGLQPAPEFQQHLVPPAQITSAPPPVRTTARPAPRKKAGFFANLLGDAPPVAVSRMASYRYDKSGGFIVTLENGQEWRQADVEGGTVSWTRAPAAYMVTITQGAFGSYSLRTGESPSVYRVEPVK
jgi:hypothetical protein